MSQGFTDALGQELQQGDIVAIAVPHGTRATQQFGIITELTVRKSRRLRDRRAEKPHVSCFVVSLFADVATLSPRDVRKKTVQLSDSVVRITSSAPIGVVETLQRALREVGKT